MKYSQCLMCKYVFGRTCKLKNEVIGDEIFFNVKKCEKRVLSLEKSSLRPIVTAGKSVVAPL